MTPTSNRGNLVVGPLHGGNSVGRHVYMIPVRPSPPLPPPQWFPPPPRPPVVWCGVVWLWVASPLPVVWCGSGVGFGGSPPSPPVAWCGLGFPPACLDLLGVFGKPMLMMILMMMMMTIIMIIIITIIFVFLWLVVGYLLPTCLLTIMALLTVGPRSLRQLSFWCNCNSVAMGQLSQGSGLSGNTVRGTAALFVGVLFRKCLQSHGTRSS